MKGLFNPRICASFVRNFTHSSSNRLSELCRSYMYVPGDKMKMINKIAELSVANSPDITIFDLEDAVSLEKKEMARDNIHSIFKSDLFSNRTNSICVRLNSIESSSIIKEDVDLVANILKLTNYEQPKMINLSKVETINDLILLDEYLKAKIDANKLKNPIKLGIMIESCRSIVNLKDLCENLIKTKSSCFEIHHAVFGSDDYCSTLGVSRSPSNAEVLYARQRFVNITKAYKILPIDMVDIDLKNKDILEANCKFAMSIGFVGKQVIHPNQLATVNKCFSPLVERVQWAEELLKEYENQKEKKGAFNFRGLMIDMPTILQAENLLHLYNLIIKKERST